MTRIEALEAVLHRYAARPFAYGQADCGALVGDYLVLAGRMPAAALGLITAPRRDETTARAALRSVGAATMAGLISKHFPRVAPLQASVGDLAATAGRHARDPACGVVIGDRVAVMGERGIEMHRLSSAVRAWRV